jgi:lysozyme
VSRPTTLSPQGAHLIAGFEGFVPHWYDDGTGVQTIGYGHTGSLPPGWKPPLTVAQGLELLQADAASAAASVTQAVRVLLGVIPARAQARFDACVSLAFNIGGGAFAGSSLVRQINARGAPRDWSPVGPYWLEWDHAGGKVLPGLLRRRQVELRVFVTGKYPSYPV